MFATASKALFIRSCLPPMPARPHSLQACHSAPQQLSMPLLQTQSTPAAPPLSYPSPRSATRLSMQHAAGKWWIRPGH
eukprot:NODE_17328_length_949_cov_4.532847.p7 GENE.NODE_17328_length_949_cov_4.532847~~NODE_17328_length_949_cov_4.532847.p7  ORF type:complete len:78 (-),score=6.13 NODE_17328_length_949_cov_4.532847:97-330(-)